ncbi:HNH endonuclease [Rhodococcus fascians]|nr:HNH endonuclease [Rhodococcus fascians]MBY4237763.1 HNH endonuclease [Rhodococcus fascians]MBY4253966.1 HNH endonuclease [Rhodococcus fascians]MBY4269163.1 HNH endonuclease [Rhodococcus fascians]
MDAVVICMNPACFKLESYSRGLCEKCYKLMNANGELHKYSRQVKNCKLCDKVFEAMSARASFCSRECTYKNRRALIKQDTAKRLNLVREGRTCAFCSGPIAFDALITARHCSGTCSSKAWAKNNPERMQELFDRYKIEHKDRMRGYWEARRCRKFGIRAGKIVAAEVYARDNYTCWICEEHVDMDLKFPDKMSKSLDHVIPLSKNGWHAMDNVALAHFGCNNAKRSSIPDKRPKWWVEDDEHEMASQP